MNTIFSFLLLISSVFSLDCSGTGQSSCKPNLPPLIQIAPGQTIQVPISFDVSCIPTAVEFSASAGLSITGSATSCSITADSSFSGTGSISIEWCDLQTNKGSSNTTCQCLCDTTPAPTTAAPTTTTAAPTTTTAAPTTTTAAPTTTTAAPTTTTAAPTTTTAAPTTTTAPPTTTTAAPTTTTAAPTTYPPTTPAPSTYPPTPAPSTAPSTPAPYTLPPTLPPVPCKGSAPSTCAVNFPTDVQMCSCEVKTFTFMFPVCKFTSFSFSYKIDAGIHLQLLHNDTDYVQVVVSADAGVEAQATLSISWCDDTGYGSKDITCHVSPNTPPTATQAPVPSAGSSTQTCSPTGPASSCHAIGPNFFTTTAGQQYSFTVSLSCPSARVFSDWATSNALCNVSSSYDSSLNPTYLLMCDTNIAKQASGIIQTKWCDSNGGYLAFTTNYQVNPLPNPSYPTLPPPPPSDVDKCRTNQPSSCQVLGPDTVSVPAGQSYTFAVTLQCPVKSCSSRWTATFGSCMVKVNYKAANPTFTITAPYGSEGRGGCIAIEWCDHNNGYTNFTLNFLVAGTAGNATDQEAALIGVMAQGDSSANAEAGSNNDWRRTGWVIFLFVLLALVVVVFLCLMARLCYTRSQAKSQQSINHGNRRSSDPQHEYVENPPQHTLDP